MTTIEILQGVHDWTNGKIVYDISAAHTDGQGNPTPYADLASALGTGGANIPEGLRKGGMSVKFIQGTVQSSDNNYVQYFYLGTSTADADFTNIDNWESQKDIKDTIKNYNSELLFDISNLNTSGESGGITYSIANGKITLSGTATSDVSIRLYYNATKPLSWFKAGNLVNVKLNRTGNTSVAQLLFYKWEPQKQIMYFKNDGFYKFPDDFSCSGSAITISILNGSTVDETLELVIIHAMSNQELSEKILQDEEVLATVPQKAEMETLKSLAERDGYSFIQSRNLLNPATIAYGKKINANTGNYSNDSDGWASDYIPAEKGDIINCFVNDSLTTFNIYATYDSNKTKIAVHNYIGYNTEITDDNVAYIRLSCKYNIANPQTQKVMICKDLELTYEPYGVLVASDEPAKTVTIKPSGGNYSSIRTAIETEGGNTTYLIYPGTYNVANDFTAEEIANANYDGVNPGFVGIRVPDGAVLRGVGQKESIIISCELDPNSYSYVTRANIATLNLMGSCKIENLTVLARYARTPIHDDFRANRGKKHLIKDCILRNEIVERNTSHGYGLGLASGLEVEINNCDIYPSMICHSNANFSLTSSLYMKNCNIKGIIGLLDDASVVPTKVTLENTTYECCAFRGGANNYTNMYVKVLSENSGFAPLYDGHYDGLMYRELPTKESIARGQMISLYAYGTAGVRCVRAETNPKQAIGICVKSATIDEAVRYLPMGYIISSFECGLTNISAGDKIGIDENGKLIVDANGEIGIVKYMIDDTYGMIQIF